MSNTQLVIIDPQNSFCKEVKPEDQQKIHDGELCVPGAWEDMERVADFIKRHGQDLDDIHVTLDSHHYFHIANPSWWRDSSGSQPQPFTLLEVNSGDQITGYQFDASGNRVECGEFLTANPNLLPWSLNYLKSLATGNRYPHCIWPPHCLIGTPGHNVVASLFEALLDWEKTNLGVVNYVTKGSNIKVEHFSALKAEVVDPNDPHTQINTNFISMLDEADKVLFAGEAGSHCLANTVRDIANAFNTNGNDEFVKKCVLLTDGTSPVPGFENYQEDFVKELSNRGMEKSTTKAFTP